MNSLITLAKQRGYLTEVAVCCVADRRRGYARETS